MKFSPIGIAVLLTLVAGGARCQESYSIPVELWDRPRNGRALLDDPGLRKLVSAMLARPESTLVIVHGRAQESLLQAEELRSWLVALAVEAERITLNASLLVGQTLRIELK